MSEPKRVLVKHMSHDGPWLLIKTRREVKERIVEIKANKPAEEIPTRLKLLAIVKEPVPPELRKSKAAWEKAYAAWEEAKATREKAYAAWNKADAAWGKIINSKDGVAFHKEVCGCGWTPKQPDILQVAPKEQEA